MTLPYAEPLTLIDPADRVVPEPPRRGEEGGEPCFPCSAGSDENLIWADENWTLHNPGQTGLPGSVWLASRAHFDSFADMPPEVGVDVRRGLRARRARRAGARRRGPGPPLPLG